MTLGLFILWLACSGYTAAVAKEKGYGSSWAVGGFIFGPIALLAAAGLPDLEMRKHIAATAGHAHSGADASPHSIGKHACDFKTPQRFNRDEYWNLACKALPSDIKMSADEQISVVGRSQIEIKNSNKETLAVAKWRGNTLGLKEWVLIDLPIHDTRLSSY